MRLLALSDIHGDVDNVRLLRAVEKNEYDAIVVAGDILGPDDNSHIQANEIMSVLATFGCPVLFVLGNWDKDVPYDIDWGDSCIHLHHRIINIGAFRLIGLSGLDLEWGMNPYSLSLTEDHTDRSKAQFIKDQKRRRSRGVASWPGLTIRERKTLLREVELRNRARLVELIKEGDPARTVVVTHSRRYRMDEEASGVLMYLFGHQHQQSDTHWRDSRYITTSCFVSG